ncbi:hypothetical protein PPEP_a4285 [Pseudoalteromonas peptidolytica F12-50-A1]|uniref:Uncharacterized protein n=1 Tax=Pseudoalteromonas peptidolytica F12-50-A1 TaxID=1315280 RepID=A0A8I0MZ55_9GAMM|nr:hypothetical protein [Pseudoalteromonas peptidolytica F12-50-A1]
MLSPLCKHDGFFKVKVEASQNDCTTVTFSSLYNKSHFRQLLKKEVSISDDILSKVFE